MSIFKKYTYLILSTLFILLVFVIFISTSASADSIRPQVNGNNDSYVDNQVKHDGYKDPEDVNDDGATVHVNNANDFLEDIGYRPGSSVNSKKANDPVSHIHKIILDNDISLADATDYADSNGHGGMSNNFDSSHSTTGDFGSYLRVKHGNMVIDGNGHTVDMLFNDFALSSDLKDENWTIENMKIYGSSWWGMISVNNSATMNYRNIDYYGSQLLWTNTRPNIKVNIYGNVGVHSLFTYKPLNADGYSYKDGDSYHQGYKCEGGGNQQNMQAGDIEFHNNSNYYGETYNGNCLELNGYSNLDNNVNVEIHPHGDDAEDKPGLFSWIFSNNHNSYGSVGLYLRHSSNYKNSNLNFGNDDNMVINCDNGQNDDGTPNDHANIYDTDGSSYLSRNPQKISCAFYSDNQTAANLNHGHDSKFTVNGTGRVYNDSPLVDIEQMNANVSGKGDGFYINSNAQQNYIPKKGLLDTENSTINVKDDGTFKMHLKNVGKTGTRNYLIDSENSIINIFRPNEVELSNDTYQKDQNNYLNKMGTDTSRTNNFIQAKDVNVHTTIGNVNSPDVNLNNVLAKKILLQLDGDRLYVPGIRLLGSYFNMIQFANALNGTLKSDHTAQNFNYVDFKGTPIPRISQISQQNVDTHEPYVHGRVVDNNGNPIANSYVKLNFNGKYYEPKDTDEDNNTFYFDGDSYFNYINSQEIIYSAIRNYIPDDLENPKGTDMAPLLKPNFYSTMGTARVSGLNMNMIKPELKSSYFNYANGYFFENYGDSNYNYNQFNAGATTYDKNGNLINSDPYVALTDNNGNFKFKIPNKIFNSLNGRSTLNVVPSYNFTDGTPKNLLASYNPLINIKNTIKDVSFPKGDSADGMAIKQAFQGGQDSGGSGDTLDFSNTISNTADNSDVSGATYTQPVPNSIDESTLQISYDNGQTFTPLKDTDYNKTNNDDGTKNISLKNISVHSGETKNIILRGTMNTTESVNNDSIKFHPYLTYGNGNSYSGNENYIDFTDNSFTFDPNDIDFGDTSKISKNELLSTVNNNNPIITNVRNNIRGHTPVNILVQQDVDKFYNDSQNNSFKGQLMYDGNSLLNTTEIFNTDSNADLYLTKARPLYLLPEESTDMSGEYKTNLTWNINRGIH